MEAMNHYADDTTEVSSTKKDEINILHLSDLHFGIEKDCTPLGVRRKYRQKELFKRLIDTLSNEECIPADWRPDVVVISGDIAWRGEYQEYELFESEFLLPLEQALGIGNERIITCPGNHDIIRDHAEGYERPYRNQRILQVKNISRESIEKRRKYHFESYVKVLCGDDPQKLCYSVTIPEWPWVHFLVLNSAWDCRDDSDEGTLRVGLDLLEEIAGEVVQGDVIVSVFHHPHTEVDDFDMKLSTKSKRNWLHISEREPEQENGICFTNFLEQRSDFILNGHIHKETKPQHSRDAKAIQLISGTAYSNDTAQYHCRILKLRLNENSQYRDIRCSLGGGDYNWEVTSPKDFSVFGFIQLNVQKKKASQEEARILLSKAQQAIELDRNSQDINGLRAVIPEMMQYIARNSEIENPFESDQSQTYGEENNLENNSSLRKIIGDRG